MAVIRLGGTEALSALAIFFKPDKGGLTRLSDPQRLILGRLVDGDEIVDQAIVSVVDDGSGEYAVDLTVHGGVRIVERVIILAQRMGATIESLEGRPEESEATIEEAVRAALVRAQTRRAVRFLALQRMALRRELESIARIWDVNTAEARARLGCLLDRSRPARYLLEGATVIVFGPVNAGKSTLVNRMFSGSQSLVSPQPGTTRDWVGTSAAIDGVPVRIIDTAGIRNKAPRLERVAIDRSTELLAEADAVIAVVDGSVPFPDGFVSLFKSMLDVERVVIAVAKSDLESAWNLSDVGLPKAAVVRTSGLTGQGLDELAHEVLAVLSIEELDSGEPIVFSMRHIDRITRILSGDIEQPPPGAIRSMLRLHR